MSKWLQTFQEFGQTWKFECPSKASYDRAKGSLRYYRAIWEGELCDPINTNDVVIDVGAHIGFFAVPIRSQVKRLIAYEPAPANFKLLVHNIALNPCKGRHALRLVPAAVGDRDGLADFFLGKSTMGHSVLYKANRKSMGEVKMISFSSIVKTFSPTVVKLDCEGGEWLILTRNNIPLLQSVRLMIAELHRTQEQDMAELGKVLKKAGFKYTLDGNTLTHMQRLIAYK